MIWWSKLLLCRDPSSLMHSHTRLYTCGSTALHPRCHVQHGSSVTWAYALQLCHLGICLAAVSLGHMLQNPSSFLTCNALAQLPLPFALLDCSGMCVHQSVSILACACTSQSASLHVRAPVSQHPGMCVHQLVSILANFNCTGGTALMAYSCFHQQELELEKASLRHLQCHCANVPFPVPAHPLSTGMVPLELGPLPHLQDSVAVIGCAMHCALLLFLAYVLGCRV